MSGRPGQGQGQRPHTWVTGPDPVTHDQYLAFLRQRAQARYRSEPWLLTFDDFQCLWRDHWHSRGRGRDDFCMSRRDRDQAWCLTNCEIMTRMHHVRLAAPARTRTQPRLLTIMVA